MLGENKPPRFTPYLTHLGHMGLTEDIWTEQLQESDVYKQGTAKGLCWTVSEQSACMYTVALL